MSALDESVHTNQAVLYTFILSSFILAAGIVHSWEKKLLWGTFLAIIHILSAWEVWLLGFMDFLCIACTILFNVYFGKFVMTFIDIG